MPRQDRGRQSARQPLLLCWWAHNRPEQEHCGVRKLLKGCHTLAASLFRGAQLNVCGGGHGIVGSGNACSCRLTGG